MVYSLNCCVTSVNIFVSWIMLKYSRTSLLKLHFWWKIPESCSGFQTSRHILHTVKPLCPQTWNSLRSMGLLRRFRGARLPRPTSCIFPIHSRISTSSEFGNYVSRAIQPRWANLHNLNNIQLDTLVENSNSTRSTSVSESGPGARYINDDSSNSKFTDFALFNSRLICNKSLLLKDFTVDNNFDFLALTETWLKTWRCWQQYSSRPLPYRV